MGVVARLLSLIEGFAHYRNPVHIALTRWRSRPGAEMTIVDRRTGVTVVASAAAYKMFGETWYARDYDVPGCPIRSGDLVLDIGAHQGFFSCYAASQGAVVQAFEPFPGSFARLVANIERNRFESLVQASPCAVSNRSGSATMRAFEDLGGGSNTIVDSHVTHLQASTTVTVTTRDINAVIDSAIAPTGSRIRLCKMDCEGSELDIVNAIANPSRIEAFAIEFHPHAYRLIDLVNAMRAWGTHQISVSRTAYVIYAVANSTLDAYTTRWD
jgi:FkbM family methyltransferase